MLLFTELQIFGHNLATEQREQLKKIIRVFQVVLVVELANIFKVIRELCCDIASKCRD